MDLPKLDFLNFDDNKIPIPSPEFLRESYKKDETVIVKRESAPLLKHERAYDAFCRWSALPEAERKPITITAFEKKWKLPQKYAFNFRQRDDFQEKRLKYFWEWMMDKFPDVVYAVYKGAVKGNSAQSKIFAELIAKKIDVDKPSQIIQPFVLMGVPQEKVDKLFVPRGYEKIEDITPVK